MGDAFQARAGTPSGLSQSPLSQAKLLIAIAESCEAATGPDPKLDVAIWLEAVADEASRKAYSEGLKISKKEAAFRASYMMDGARYTASIDAAMTLAPEGAAWGVGHGVDHEDDNESGWAWCGNSEFPNSGFYYWCATPALALCVAALRAIATEARRAETQNSGSVHEGAGPQDIAQKEGE